MAFDVFISYASKDKIVADAVCARLEASGIRCWIAPRDIVAGRSYGEAIIEAIHGAKVMVLVFSSSANASGHIPKEVERAVSNGVAVLPFRIEDVAPGKSLDYFIGSVHWLDAMTPPMEKHLDNLAATVHKLLPVKMGETAPPTDATVMWQRNAAGGAAATAGAAAGAGSDGPRASFLTSKTVLIGAAAVLVLAAVVVGMMLMRGSGNSQGAGDSPAATNPSGGNDAVSDPNSGDNAATPAPKAVPSSHRTTSSGVNGRVDPIVGCYQWFSNTPVTIHADGTVTGGPFTAHWRLVDAERRAYTFTWPVMIETLTVSPDQRTMSGGNQYGYPISGGRVSGSTGLAGTWHWANGWNVSVAPNGSFTSGTFRGTWRTVDAARGIYEMNWPSPVDSVLLLGGGTRLSGANQYGVAISGTKTGACGGN
ncbi:MAG: toll/interleukin-1 receptor domain-containing protein [Candidatus Acidiferrales bacterium]